MAKESVVSRMWSSRTLVTLSISLSYGLVSSGRTCDELL